MGKEGWEERGVSLVGGGRKGGEGIGYVSFCIVG